MMPQLHVCARPRPKLLLLSEHSCSIVRAILDGEISHKRLKDAFDWENTPEGHAYWSKVRQAAGLPREAALKLQRACGL